MASRRATKGVESVRTVQALGYRADVYNGREVRFFSPAPGDSWNAAGSAELFRGKVRAPSGLAIPRDAVAALTAKIEAAS